MTAPIPHNATYDPDVETHAVELTCRHLALQTLPLYSDWLGSRVPCEVCGCDRTIVRVEENR